MGTRHEDKDYLTDQIMKAGIITELYSPKNDKNIKSGERVFYTRRNAMYIDTIRNLIETVPDEYKKYFLAPLIAILLFTMAIQMKS